MPTIGVGSRKPKSIGWLSERRRESYIPIKPVDWQLRWHSIKPWRMANWR